MGEKVLLLIAALELWPALWSTKDRSDTLQWLGLVNICLTSGMPRFLLASPTNPDIYSTFNSSSPGFTHLGLSGRHAYISAISTGTASWGRFNNICKCDSLAVLVLFWSSSVIRGIEWLFQRKVSSSPAPFSAFPDKSEQATPIMYHVVWTYKYTCAAIYVMHTFLMINLVLKQRP